MRREGRSKEWEQQMQRLRDVPKSLGAACCWGMKVVKVWHGPVLVTPCGVWGNEVVSGSFGKSVVLDGVLLGQTCERVFS